MLRAVRICAGIASGAARDAVAASAEAAEATETPSDMRHESLRWGARRQSHLRVVRAAIAPWDDACGWKAQRGSQATTPSAGEGGGAETEGEGEREGEKMHGFTL